VYELLWLTRIRHCFSGAAVDANRLTVILFAIFVPIMRVYSRVRITSPFIEKGYGNSGLIDLGVAPDSWWCQYFGL
jgi:hypothetical protein